MIYEIPVVRRSVVERSVVELVETKRRMLRVSSRTPSHDPRPSRARRERIPMQLRVWGASSRIRPVVE